MFLRSIMAVAAVTAVSAVDVSAEPQFPFDQVLNMDVRPMAPSKRKPSMTVAPNGSAVIDLWCKSIEGRVEVSGDAISIAPAELPETTPAAISYGQCTPERMQADEMLRGALSQVSNWRRQGSALLLTGPSTMKFFPSTN